MLQGFGNHHQSEAIKGALPRDQNSPQHCQLGLYAEQLSGSAFARPRHRNLHSWLYRILPSVAQGAYKPYKQKLISAFTKEQSPNPLRWSPLERLNRNQSNFVDGLFHFAGSQFVNAYLYQCNVSMDCQYFTDHDGELLFIPYQGELNLHTEMGCIHLKPEMIAVIPRGVKFRVELISHEARGYLCENSANPLTLPELGFMGANGLANPRHFNYPTASFETTQSKSHVLICKHQQRLWINELDHSPLNVVAWHGNYAPYSYDLNLFNTFNTVSFDHPDPSIYTVLTSESDTPGVAQLDFVIFPARWTVAEHSFRLPYFHRNVMNEFMGLIKGEYDAKKEGFLPGAVSIHDCMSAHGPDKISYEQNIAALLKPEKYTDTLAFMLETRDLWQATEAAFNSPCRQEDYLHCWQGFKPASLK